MKRILGLTIVLSILLLPIYPRALAENPQPSQFRVADDVSDCKGTLYRGSTPKGKEDTVLPANCIFIEEPIGGEVGRDLYVKSCSEADPDKNVPAYCEYTLWGGGALKATQYGPYQAIISYEKGKEWQGSFGLLYNYVGLIYKYLSGLIIGVVVLITAFGGIEIITAAGDSAKVTSGKDHILHALLGMVLWFLSSLILYTINPTFFRWL